MKGEQIRILLISDANIATFAGYLNNDVRYPRVQAECVPFGQVIPVLLDEQAECWKTNPDVMFLWTTPAGVLPSFHELMCYRPVPIGQLIEEVDAFAYHISAASHRVRHTFLPTWELPSDHRVLGVLEMNNDRGLSRVLMQAHVRLSERFEDDPNVFLLSSRRWFQNAGRYAHVPKSWYMAKVPFGNAVFQEAVTDLKAALAATSGNTKKLLIVDLDDTLWGGIVGEVGWEKLRLGGHDHVGEAFVDFQQALKSLTNRGILLGIVSKNEGSTALTAIDKHPEMVLKLNDFAGWRINWDDKASNVASLVDELNLGLDSVVFIDNSPFERARVKDALPDVAVPDWPGDVTLFRTALLTLPYFDSASLTGEDLNRTKMYAVDRQRTVCFTEAQSIDQWYKSLNMTVTIEDPGAPNRERMVQLFNKTNQMNMSTRRLSESELLDWIGQDNHKLWLFRVSDKFGDMGITGIISLEEAGHRVGRVVDFLLSCRVMGRGLEQAMLCTLIEYARSRGLEIVWAKYIATAKNNPCLQFWKKSACHYVEKNDVFEWRVAKSYLWPLHLERRG